EDEVDERHRIEESARNQGCVLIDRHPVIHVCLDDEPDLVEKLVLPVAHETGTGCVAAMQQSSSQAARTRARVSAREILPAVLLTIHFGGTRKTFCGTIPTALEMAARTSASTVPTSRRATSSCTSATTSRLSVPSDS